MRKELEYIQIIENYLKGELSAKDQTLFEQRLKSNKQLQVDVEKQKVLAEGIKRSALVASSTKAYKSYKFFKTIKTLGLITMVATVAAISYFMLNPTDKINEEGNQSEVVKTEELKFEDFTNSLPTTVFEINTKSDTVVETENGLIFVIPKNGFETMDGNP